MTEPTGVQITVEQTDSDREILTGEALELLADLHRTFEARRQELLRALRQV